MRILDKNDMDAAWLDKMAPVPHVVGYGQIPRGWMDARRLIYDHQLLFFAPGPGARVEFDDATVDVPGGAFIVIPPGRWHRRRSLADQAATRAWVHFDWQPAREPRPERGILYSPAQFQPECVRRAPHYVPDGILVGKIGRFDRFFRRQERLNRMFNEGTDRDRLLCRGVLLEHLLDLLAPPDEGSRHAPDDLALRVREALGRLAAQQFDAAPSIRETLEGLGLSYDHQARVFREAYGVTPLNYVNALRVERAKVLLRDTDLRVKQVALALGFRDVPYFDRLFRQYAGCTPTDYR